MERQPEPVAQLYWRPFHLLGQWHAPPVECAKRRQSIVENRMSRNGKYDCLPIRLFDWRLKENDTNYSPETTVYFLSLLLTITFKTIVENIVHNFI